MSEDAEEWGEEPKLKPVMPVAPDLHTTMDEHGRKRQPKRASRRSKFLGLVEPELPQGSGGGHEVFVHGRDMYDLATGPRSPQVRRPIPTEWDETALTGERADAAQKIVKGRKEMPKGQKSLNKKLGSRKKK